MMALPTAYGAGPELLLGVRALIAESETFQGWVGAEDATEALDSIHLFRTTRAQHEARPYCIVDAGPMKGRTDSADALDGFISNGEVGVLFVRDVQVGYTAPGDGGLEFWGATIDGEDGGVEKILEDVFTSEDGPLFRGYEYPFGGPQLVDESEGMGEADALGDTPGKPFWEIFVSIQIGWSM